MFRTPDPRSIDSESNWVPSLRKVGKQCVAFTYFFHKIGRPSLVIQHLSALQVLPSSPASATYTSPVLGIFKVSSEALILIGAAQEDLWTHLDKANQNTETHNVESDSKHGTALPDDIPKHASWDCQHLPTNFYLKHRVVRRDIFQCNKIHSGCFRRTFCCIHSYTEHGRFIWKTTAWAFTFIRLGSNSTPTLQTFPSGFQRCPWHMLLYP